jgi:hypothetical protein
MGRKKSDDDEASEEAEPEAAAAPAPAAPPPPPAAPMKRYRVLERRVFSWRGQMSTLEKGDVIREAGYGGAAGIARLTESGVLLEEVK